MATDPKAEAKNVSDKSAENHQGHDNNSEAQHKQRQFPIRLSSRRQIQIDCKFKSHLQITTKKGRLGVLDHM